MQTFFVPIDFSVNAHVALRYAAHLAQAFGDTKLVVHFMENKQAISSEEHVQNLRERIGDFVAHSLRKDQLEKTIPWQASTSGGVRLSALVDEAAVQQASLIVMGTKGVSGLLEQLRGSNTYEVVKASSKPVLVVPGHARYRPLRSILYCSDFDEMESLNDLGLVKGLAMLFDAEVRIAHVKLSKEKPSAEHLLESGRQARFFDPEVRHQFKVIRHKSISDGLQYYIKLKHDNDLIVMVKREHGMLESLFLKNHTREMVFHTHLPLLVIGDK